MATISQAPASLDLVAVKGDDFTVTLTVTENSVAYDWTGATVATSIIDSTGTAVATNFTATTSTGGVLTLTLSDANTTTLGVGTWRWQVNVTKASATRSWLAGGLSIMQAGWAGTSTSSASLSITTGAATVAISNNATVASTVAVIDAGSYYAGTNVETVLAEQALKLRLRLSTLDLLPLASLADLAASTPTFATSGPGGATPITSATTLPYNTSSVTSRGAIGTLYTQFSTNYLRNNINGSWTTPPWWIEFDYYGSDFAIRFRNVSANNSQFWVWVDGKPTTSTAQTSTAASAGSLYYYRVTFGSVAQRRIRVFLRLADFGGLDIGPTDTVSPTTQTSRKVVFYGDSWIEGSGSTATDDVLWSARVGESMHADWYRLGQGGTGFVATGGGGSKAAYTNSTRLSTIATLQPDLVVLCGSINDDGSSGITAAVQSVLANIQTNCPSTSVLLVSPPPTSGSPSANRTSNASAVLAGATGYSNVIATIDQVTTPWITGTGKVGSTTGSGNADLFIYSDGAHLTQAGHSYWSSRMQSEITRILSSYSTP